MRTKDNFSVELWSNEMWAVAAVHRCANYADAMPVLAAIFQPTRLYNYFLNVLVRLVSYF